MFEYEWETELRDLVYSKQWQKVLSLRDRYPKEQLTRYLWAWPTELNLNFLKSHLCEVGVSDILSVGCGCGLFEWILHESTGLRVKGLEYDRSWWTSNYSPKSFINLNFSINPMNSEHLLKSCNTDNWNFALLFCYFNNKMAFLDYLKCYNGKIIIIIGPADGKGVHTEPTPFNPDFGDNYGWELLAHSEIDKTGDFIAIYYKKENVNFFI